jgi:hypothetical protein
MTMFNSNSTKKLAQIEELNKLLTNNIKDVLRELGIKYRLNGEYITMSCPIHDSNNPRSLSIVVSDYSPNFGIWHCWSKKCHETHGKTILGFIRGVLSNQQQQILSKSEIIQWSLRFLGLKSINEVKTASEIDLKKKHLEKSTTTSTSISIGSLNEHIQKLL